MVYLVIIIVVDDDPDEACPAFREAADMSEADFSRQRRRPVVPGQAVCRQDPDLHAAHRLDDRMPVPDLLDGDDQLQDSAERHAGRAGALGRLHASLARLAFPWPFAGDDRRRKHRARRVPEALFQFLHHRALVFGDRGGARLARRLRPVALLLQVRLHAQRGHLLLLPLPAHPAAGRARPALPGPLPGTRPPRHHGSGSSSSIR